MKRLILNLAVSLDGFIEGPNGEFDWCLTDQDYGMKEFLSRIDTIFFGRKSYEVLLNMEKNPFPRMTKYVFSASRKSMAGAIVIQDSIAENVRAIKKRPGKDIWLFGGASLTSQLINQGLVDELQLAVHPLLLGQGTPLVADIAQRIPLKLADIKMYTSGLVQLFYDVPQKTDKRRKKK